MTDRSVVPIRNRHNYRYEVRCLDELGLPKVVGWTDCQDGGYLVQMVDRNPKWSAPRVVDLHTNMVVCA